MFGWSHFRGFGDSSKDVSLCETSVVEDGLAALQWLNTWVNLIYLVSECFIECCQLDGVVLCLQCIWHIYLIDSINRQRERKGFWCGVTVWAVLLPVKWDNNRIFTIISIILIITWGHRSTEFSWNITLMPQHEHYFRCALKNVPAPKLLPGFNKVAGARLGLGSWLHLWQVGHCSAQVSSFKWVISHGLVWF